VQKQAVFADVVADIYQNQNDTVKKLSLANGLSRNNLRNPLNIDLNLAKKTAKWVPKLIIIKMQIEKEGLTRRSWRCSTKTLRLCCGTLLP
jgi:hypothetical protein